MTDEEKIIIKIGGAFKAQCKYHERLQSLMKSAKIEDVTDENGWTLEMNCTNGMSLSRSEIADLVQKFITIRDTL